MYRSIYLLSISISLLVPKGLAMLLTLFVTIQAIQEIAEDDNIIRHNVTSLLMTIMKEYETRDSREICW